MSFFFIFNFIFFVLFEFWTKKPGTYSANGVRFKNQNAFLFKYFCNVIIINTILNRRYTSECVIIILINVNCGKPLLVYYYGITI